MPAARAGTRSSGSLVDHYRVAVKVSLTLPPYWSLKPPGEFGKLTWSDVSFVFDPSSGQTHFLNEVSVGIIDVLRRGPLPAPLLADRIRERYAIDEDERLLDAIVNALDQMDALGLVEQLP